MTEELPTISNLERMRENLPPEMKVLFDRHFEVISTVGVAKVRSSLVEWVVDPKRFGSVEVVEAQRIVRVDNLITREGALFNELRTKRPMQKKVIDLDQRIEDERKVCDFCPVFKETRTLIDTLTGEIKHGNEEDPDCFVIGNLAKYDARHSQIIFPAASPQHDPDRHHPLKITRAMVETWFALAIEWYKRIHQADADALFPVFGWNTIWKAGASILHPHPHIIVARRKHYPRIQFLNEARLAYQQKYGTDYFEDFFRIHQILGIGEESNGIRILANLVPRKEKEIIILSKAATPAFIEIFYGVVNCLINHLGVQSFNVVVLFPPLESLSEWKEFPVFARFLDRGSLTSDTADFGFMEPYLSSVIASDPFKIFPIIRETIRV